MLKHVIEKELKDCVYSYRSLLLFALSAVLFSMSIYLEGRQYQTDLQDYRIAQTRLRQSMGEATTLYALSSTPFNFVKRPPVLGILVRGVESYAPHVYMLRLFTLPAPQGSGVSENPTVAVFGAMDAAFIVQVVLGLAALLFTFSAVCGEKEMGTLKLQLANAVAKDTLLLGKLGGNLVGLLVPVLLAFLVGCLTLITLDGVSLGEAELFRMLLIGLDFVLYLTVLFSLGLCVSTLTNRATTAFAVCLVIWVLLIAVVPKAAVIAANGISPVESLSEYETKKSDIDRRGSIEFDELIQRYNSEHPERTIPQAQYDDFLKLVRDEQNRELRKLEEEYLLRKESQARKAILLARLSPAGSASYAAMSLAGTGPERDYRFRTALREYRSMFTVYYDKKNSEEIARHGNPAVGGMLVKKVFSDLPAFEFHEEPLAASVDRALPDLGFLALWSALFFITAYFYFLRYDVR
jgi:ABC-type transport system involved in multi-copper enzyme maturation permease subunit